MYAGKFREPTFSVKHQQICDGNITTPPPGVM